MIRLFEQHVHRKQREFEGLWTVQIAENKYKILVPGCIERYAADLTTQVTDGVDYVNEKHTSIINDNIHGIMLKPEGTLTNNGTKGNLCLVAEQLL